MFSIVISHEGLLSIENYITQDCVILLMLLPLFAILSSAAGANILWLGQNVGHFPDDIFKCIFVNENVWIPIKISLKFVPEGPINNIPALIQIMAWRRSGDKPLSEPVVVSLLTHLCVTRPRWVKARINLTMVSLFLLITPHCPGFLSEMSLIHWHKNLLRCR